MRIWILTEDMMYEGERQLGVYGDHDAAWRWALGLAAEKPNANLRASWTLTEYEIDGPLPGRVVAEGELHRCPPTRAWLLEANGCAPLPLNSDSGQRLFYKHVPAVTSPPPAAGRFAPWPAPAAPPPAAAG